MASTIIIYEGDGTTTDFTVPFDYLKKSFVTVRLGPALLLLGVTMVIPAVTITS